MRFIIAALAGITIGASPGYAEIRIIGKNPSALPFRDGLGLVEILEGVDGFACSSVHVTRGNTTIAVSLRPILEDLSRDWRLQDGDIIFMMEHVVPCLEDGDSALFVELITDWNRIRRGELKEPPNWRIRVANLPTHKKLMKPNKAVEPTPVAVTNRAFPPFGRARFAPATSVAHL